MLRRWGKGVGVVSLERRLEFKTEKGVYGFIFTDEGEEADFLRDWLETRLEP